MEKLGLRPQLPWVERMARADQKRRLVLRFLREEIYTARPVVDELLGGVASSTGIRLLRSMQRDGLVKHARLPGDSIRRAIDLWGITLQGQAMAYDYDAGEKCIERWFRPGDVAISQLKHRLGLQRLRVSMERKGWRNWLNGASLGKLKAGQHRPDAFAVHPMTGMTFAIELELSFKNVKRYLPIARQHVNALRARKVEGCVWICPQAMQSRLAKIIDDARRRIVADDILNQLPKDLANRLVVKPLPAALEQKPRGRPQTFPKKSA